MTSMLPPLIPENAPFSLEQRAWLNGFFAGLMGAKGSSNGVTSNGIDLPLAAMNGSSANGNAAAPAEEEFPWHDASLGMAERMELAAEKPYERRLMAAMAQLDCGACGYLCQTYSEAIADGSEKDLTRCSPGGSETSKKLKELVSLEKLTASAKAITTQDVATTTAPVQKTASVAASATYTRNNPFAAKVLQVETLNKPGSAKDTRQIVFDLSGSGLSYEPGDSLGVYPRNCPTTVAAIIERLGCQPTEEVSLGNGLTTSVAQALDEHCTISSVGETALQFLVDATKNAAHKDQLKRLIEGEMPELEGADLLELLEHFSLSEFKPGELIAALTPLSPRLYSIASSQADVRDEVHLTVGVVGYELRSKRRGVCSNFLAHHAQVGSTVNIFFQTAHNFRLPSDATKPVIMIGPGTGIAPFRSFLQERAAKQASGKNWLFFGDQRGATDFLYREELEKYQERGILTRLDTAFSRDQAEKVYVQDRMREQASTLWSWLQEGACLYVCGDAKRMAVDVDDALVEIVSQQAKLPLPSAKQWVKDLAKQKRYLRDVY